MVDIEERGVCSASLEELDEQLWAIVYIYVGPDVARCRLIFPPSGKTSIPYRLRLSNIDTTIKSSSWCESIISLVNL